MANEVYTPETRCSYKFYNSESTLDKTAMSISFWNGLLKLSISPIVIKDDGSSRIDTESHTDIYLSPSKASMLLYYFRDFRHNPDKYTNVGVNTNKGIIFIASPKQHNTKNPVIIIDLLDENGAKKAEAGYEFNSEYFAVTNYMGGTDFSKDNSYANSIELDTFEMILKTFIESATSAIAASVVEATKFSADREFNFMKDVRNKLGIQFSSGHSNNVRSNSSAFFNKNNNIYSDSSKKNNNTVDSYEDIISDVASMME